MGPTFLCRVEAAVAMLTCVLTILVFTHFMPLPPRDGLDPSWKYALDFGSAKGMPFGQALVFTFGPLVSLYTDVRVREHDLLYVVAESLLALAIFAGFAIGSRPGHRAYLLLLPLLLANIIIKDAIFLIMPLMLVLAACRAREANIAWHAAFGAMALADGLLLLVKGSLILPVAACTILACAALMRDRSFWAIVLPVITLGTALLTWLAMGQPIAVIPIYLANMIQITDGYTDAMSVYGPLVHPLVFAGLGLGLTGVLAWTEPRHRAVVILAGLLITFVAFKAGFVRQDGHATLAAAVLALLGLLILLRTADRRSYFGLAGLIGWYIIASAYVPLGAATIRARFIHDLASSASAIALHFRHPERLFADYEAAKADIRARGDLPRLADTVDIYPVDIALLLASDLRWDPRPVLQSYSAYTPSLAAMNARHLDGPRAPANVLFDVATIDNRFPSLEDGASWPALLSHYGFQTFSGNFALLKRTDVDHHAVIEPPTIVSSAVPFGAEIPIPNTMHLVWASFSFHSPMPGRVLSTVFRRPQLLLDVTYRSGQIRTYRLVPGMTNGFLLSPVVHSGRDFVALSSGDPDLLTLQEVRSFKLRQDSYFPLWGGSFDVALSSLTFKPHHVDRSKLYGSSNEGTAIAQLPDGGRCSIDVVGSSRLGANGVTVDTPSVEVEGWAFVPSADMHDGAQVRIALTDQNGHTFYSEAQRTRRPDATRAFGLPDDIPVGFAGIVDLRSLHGDLDLRIVQQGPEGALVCRTAVITIRH